MYWQFGGMHVQFIHFTVHTPFYILRAIHEIFTISKKNIEKILFGADLKMFRDTN